MTEKNQQQDGVRYANSSSLPTPAGHYSHLCIAGDFVFVAGILPVTEQGEPLVHGTFEEQAQQVFKNLDACLQQEGLGHQHLAQVRIFIADMAHWPTFNCLYAEWMGAPKPARLVAGVSELHYGLQLEVEVTAYRKAK